MAQGKIEEHRASLLYSLCLLRTIYENIEAQIGEILRIFNSSIPQNDPHIKLWKRARFDIS